MAEQLKLKRMVARNMVHMVHLVIFWRQEPHQQWQQPPTVHEKEQPQEEKEIALSGRQRVNVHVEKVFVQLRARPGKRGATKRTPSPRRNSPGSTKCCRKTNKSIREKGRPTSFDFKIKANPAIIGTLRRFQIKEKQAMKEYL